MPRPDRREPTAATAAERLDEILEELSRDDSIAETVIQRGRSQFPAYASVPIADLIEAVHRNRALAIQTLRSGVSPPPEQIWEAALSTSERLAQGLSITDIMGGFRESLRVIQNRVIELTGERGLDPRVALRASTLLWDLGDTFSARISLAYREIQIADEVARKQELEQFVRRLLTGDLTEAEHRAAGSRFAGSGPVRAIVTAPLPVPLPAPLPDTLLMDQGRAIGYVAVGETLPATISYSEGSPGEWQMLPESYRLAQQLQATAELLGRSGRSTLADLSWRIGVPASPALNEFLRRSYIDPVLAEGEFGALILDSIGAFIEHGLRVDAAAKSLPVHPNTLRYRMQKFEELTESSLGDFDTLVEVAWALAVAGGSKGQHAD
ncbi:helix-turn-helix domain-containing protein [Leucobacter sp. NPDC015123]|uniref:helix-turn-helix domain-containing protein n=1 Tax=Leucobacter sp. NPDC015123 TaxID=3364129 RepID=UPI0036F4AABA